MLNVIEIMRVHLFSTAGIFSLAEFRRGGGRLGRTDGQERPDLPEFMFLNLPCALQEHDKGFFFFCCCYAK